MMKNCRSPSLWALATLACVVLSLPIGADEARTPLPDPDDRPADMSKPVQVYILMGQSNMLGFGKINGANGSLTHAVKEKSSVRMRSRYKRSSWRPSSRRSTGRSSRRSPRSKG